MGKLKSPFTLTFYPMIPKVLRDFAAFLIICIFYKMWKLALAVSLAV